VHVVANQKKGAGACQQRLPSSTEKKGTMQVCEKQKEHTRSRETQVIIFFFLEMIFWAALWSSSPLPSTALSTVSSLSA
jgi:hypothetical protein